MLHARPVASTENLIDELASFFVNTNREYYFGNIADRAVFEQHLSRFADCIDGLSKIALSGKIRALNRLLTCYVEHTHDGGETKGDTLTAVMGDNGLSALLEHLAAYSDTLEVWADFLSCSLDKFDE